MNDDFLDNLRKVSLEVDKFETEYKARIRSYIFLICLLIIIVVVNM